MSVYLPLYVGDCFSSCLERCMSDIMTGVYNYIDMNVPGVCYSYFLHCREKCMRSCHDP